MYKKVIACAAGAGVLLASLCGCSGKGETVEYGQAEELMAVEDFPRLDGSTATLPLGRAVTRYFTGMDAEEAELKVSFNTTDDSYYNLLYGAADLLLVYEGSELVQQALADEGIEVEKKVIGYDALVFLTPEDNPVDNLTTEQIRDIYTGKTTNWSELGGEDTPILAYQRNLDSGSQTLMLNLVMGDTLIADAPTELTPGGMGSLLEEVAKYDNSGGAIGYSVYFYVSSMYSIPGVKLLSVDGVKPANEAIASGEYPFVNPFYAIIRADEPQDSPARQVYDFLGAPEGVELIGKAGYVSTVG